ncbi:hypothetical protein C7271_17955 [filamentous cyanobacterium CCP5]|nr:hypothetical protein C7293_13735 [filamentous cyanobacterium CCT1]PSN17394.1 hypothetical protein C7271_17955 [filamentous cyanobacterium CCP5]PSN80408.1 hypothetical protein C8B47_06790 [filamentous cyanobacterium CCP4]
MTAAILRVPNPPETEITLASNTSQGIEAYTGSAMSACPRCQSDRQRVSPGTDPHYGQLSCGDCGRLLKWLSKREVEARGGFQVEQLSLLGGAL